MSRSAIRVMSTRYLRGTTEGSDRRPSRASATSRDVGLTLRQQGVKVERAQLSLEQGRVQQDDVGTPVDGDHDGPARPVELGEDLADLPLELRDRLDVLGQAETHF